MMKRKMLFMLLAVVLAAGSAQAILVGGIDFDVIGEGGGSVTVLGDTLTLDGIQGVWDDNYTYANATIAPIAGDSLVFDLTLSTDAGAADRNSGVSIGDGSQAWKWYVDETWVHGPGDVWANIVVGTGNTVNVQVDFSAASYDVTMTSGAISNTWTIVADISTVTTLGVWTYNTDQDLTLTVNSGPAPPSAVDPTNGAEYVDIDTDLSWNASPEYVPDGYYLYLRPDDANFLDTTNNILDGVSVAASADPVTYPHSGLDNITPYYWRVDSIDPNNGAPVTREGPVWSFTTIASSPEIFVHPVSQTADPNDDVEFSVSGSNLNTFQWHDDSGEITGEISDTLILSTVDENDEGTYYCVAGNGAGDFTTSANARLWIKRLIAHWTFDDTLIDTVDGWVGVYADPDVNNPDVTGTEQYDAAFIVSGKSHKSNGDDLHLEVAGSEEYFNFYINGYTVAAWINTTDSEGIEWQWGGVAQKFDTDDGWALFTTPFQASSSLVKDTGYNAMSVEDINDGQWHLLVGNYDPAARIIRLFVDGELVGETSGESIPDAVGPSTGPLLIGTGPFEGLIDDLKIYSYAFTPEAVAQMWFDETGERTCIHGFAGEGLDFNNNCIVELGDLAIFAMYWLNSGIYPAL